MRRILFVLCTIGLVVSGCGEDEEPSTAYKLATIDGESPSGNDDPIVDEYQQSLDAAVDGCQQEADAVGDEPGVSDMAVTMNEQQPENWTVLAALDGIAEAVPAESPPMDCVEIAASLLVMTDG